MVKVGEAVLYTDPYGHSFDAVVTADWNITEENPLGSINLVYVSGNTSETDQYGRQIKRDTSVPHRTNQSAPGRFWEIV